MYNVVPSFVVSLIDTVLYVYLSQRGTINSVMGLKTFRVSLDDCASNATRGTRISGSRTISPLYNIERCF